MRLQIPAHKIFASTAAMLLVMAGALSASTGCSSKKSASEVAETTSTLNSQKLQKLTPQQVDQKIQEVQANPSIPDSAKPNIIDSIRAQGQP